MPRYVTVNVVGKSFDTEGDCIAYLLAHNVDITSPTCKGLQVIPVDPDVNKGCLLGFPIDDLTIRSAAARIVSLRARYTQIFDDKPSLVIQKIRVK